MAQLTASDKTTTIAREEADWLSIIIRFKHKHPAVRIASDRQLVDYPHLQKLIDAHYEKYKYLTLGDGIWHYNKQAFIDKCIHDTARSIQRLEAARRALLTLPADIRKQKTDLYEKLYLNQHTTDTAELLAELGHSRITFRTDGWIPLIKSVIEVGVVLAERLKLRDESDLNYMTIEELREAVKREKVASVATIFRRRDLGQFIMLNHNGTYHIVYGEAARRMKDKYIPRVNHSKTTEVSGNIAMTGRVKGNALVYKWGDDIAQAAEAIKTNPILVAGQTRPSMMPIIRGAKGIVTDEGGVTSHSAIVAREMGIPTIINTKIATKVFKTGDKILLDAENGIVRKIS